MIAVDLAAYRPPRPGCRRALGCADSGDVGWPLVYWRTRKSNRSALAWAMILWLSLFAGGAIGFLACLIVYLAVFSSHLNLDELLTASSRCGMALAMTIVIRAAGRPIQTPSTPSKIKSSRTFWRRRFLPGAVIIGYLATWAGWVTYAHDLKASAWVTRPRNESRLTRRRCAS